MIEQAIRNGYLEREIPIDSLATIIRRSHDPESFALNCLHHGKYPSQISEAMAEKRTSSKLIDIFMQDPVRFRYQLGVAGSRVGYTDLTEHQISQLDTVKFGNDFQVRVYDPVWDLCYRSEDYLNQALNKNESLLVVNRGKMLAKSKGYKTLLALETFSGEKSTIVAGNWYTPVGQTKDQVKNAFKENLSNIDLCDGEFVLMRALSDGKFSDRLFERAKAYVAGGNFGRTKFETIRQEIKRGF